LADGGFKNYLAAKNDLSDGRQALKKGDLEAAMVSAKAAEKNNPGFYQNSWLLAEVLFRQGKPAEAAQACRRALDGQPALIGERRKIQELLGRIAAKK